MTRAIMERQRHRQLELMTKSLCNPERSPRSGTSRLILPDVMEMFWTSGIVIVIDPGTDAKEIAAVIPVEGDPEGGLLIARYDFSVALEGRHLLAAPDISGAICHLAWWILHHDLPTEETQVYDDGGVVPTYADGDVLCAIQATIEYFRRFHDALLKRFSERSE